MRESVGITETLFLQIVRRYPCWLWRE